MILEKILLKSPISINVPTRASLAVETKGLLFLWLVHLNNKSNGCKQMYLPFGHDCLLNFVSCSTLRIDPFLFYMEKVITQ